MQLSSERKPWLRAGAILIALPSIVCAQTPTVLPIVETEPVPSSGDAADDPAVWVHPVVRSLSTVIGTDKDSGVGVYDLDGTQIQFLTDGELNNVDLRYGFPLGGGPVALVTAGERGQNVLAIYAVDADTRMLENVAARPIPFGIDIYGSCMYRSPLSGEYYFFGNSKEGEVEQWRLFDDGSGLVDAQLVRTFDVGGQTEGCVADDENAWLFIGEESTGIWRYGAEPGDGDVRVSVDTTGPGGNLTADVEGLALYYTASQGGYLLASSQGNDTFVVYDRNPPHGHLLTFEVGENLLLGIDAVSETDGIEVMNLGLGSAFPQGVFVVQDGSNAGENQNYKLIPWQDVAAAATPPLIVDSVYDPYGTACPNAGWSLRAGTNPIRLTTPGGPVLGSTWTAFLDCTGHAPDLGVLFAFRDGGMGLHVDAGELLVDPTSRFLLLRFVPHGGGVVSFSEQAPAAPALCGRRASVQGLCLGAPGPVLSNAIDVTFGL